MNCCDTGGKRTSAVLIAVKLKVKWMISKCKFDACQQSSRLNGALSGVKCCNCCSCWYNWVG